MVGARAESLHELLQVGLFGHAVGHCLARARRGVAEEALGEVGQALRLLGSGSHEGQS